MPFIDTLTSLLDKLIADGDNLVKNASSANAYQTSKNRIYESILTTTNPTPPSPFPR